MLDLRYVGGRREFHKTKEEAETAREQKLIELKNHGTTALSLTNDERLDFVRTRDRLTKLGATISQAADFFEEHHQQIEKLRG